MLVGMRIIYGWLSWVIGLVWTGRGFESSRVSDYLRGFSLNPGCTPDSDAKKWMGLHFEYYAGSGTSFLDQALETSQGSQAQQKTPGRRGLGNNSQLILGQVAVRVEQVQGYDTIRSA